MTPARYPDGMETRFAAECRAVAGRRLEGYAAVFDSPAQIGAFVERVAPGAFTATLAARKDVRALVDHIDTQLLARTSSGTLQLAQDSRGLHFSIAVPDTTLGRDVLAMAERNDLSGCSFGFRVISEAWPTRTSRELHSVDLAEISILHTLPAYSQTSVAARARALGRAEAIARLRALAVTL
jgi:hypothetical protein